MDRRFDQLQALAAARAARRSRTSPSSEATSTRALDGQLSESIAYGASVGPRAAEVAYRLDLAIQAAAVSGHFDPLQLFEAGAELDLRRAVLTQLARNCILPVGAEAKWLLSSDRRSEVLRDAKPETIADILGRSLPEPDTFGATLRETLRSGASAKIEVVDRTQALEALSALEFVRASGRSTPETAALEAKVAQSNFLADYSTLLSTGLYGRTRELRRLQSFLNSDGPKSGSRWSSLVVSGLGGAGKSTLVAHFLKEIADRDEATIAVLDFDRPGVDAAEPHLLELEAVRQIGYQRPELEPDLRNAREMIRDYRESLSDESFTSHQLESVERSLRSLLEDTASILNAHDLETKPLLLVLDTMEEVIVAGLAAKLTAWLDSLCEAFEPIPLKVIFSGRLTGAYGASADEDVSALPVELGLRRPTQLILDQLPRQAAVRLLRQSGVRPRDIDILLAGRVIPRRPLELKLLARLFAEWPDASAADIVADLRHGGQMAKELFSGLVYRRVLLRIRDDHVRKLAHPGLVLRFIDEDIVTKVLVPALGLSMNATAIKNATDGLASYAWLASRHSDGAIWHRRDLRRSMLKAMIAQEPAKTREINRLAANYFRDRRDEAAQAEHMYHVLMLAEEAADVGVFEIRLVKRLARHFLPDVVDLPLVAQVYVRHAMQLPLRSEDLYLLPAAYRDDAIEKAGRRLVAAREFGQAARLVVLPEVDGSFFAPGRSMPVEGWRAETLFATVQWRELISRSAPMPAPRISTVQELANLLFPRELVWVRPTMFGAELDKLVDVRDIHVEAPAHKDSLSAFSARIALGLALVAQRSELGPRTINLAADMVDADERSRLSPGIGPRQLLLVGIGAVSRPIGLKIRASQLRLESDWLEGFRSELLLRQNVSAIPALEEASNTFRSSFAEQGLSISRLLAKIDAPESKRRDGGLPIRFEASEWSEGKAGLYLRGPDPELRDSLRYALAEAFDSSGDRTVADLVAHALPREFRETRPRTFRAALEADAAKALLLPLELVDRVGATGALLNAAVHRFPESDKLRSVAASYGRLGVAVDFIFERFGR